MNCMTEDFLHVFHTCIIPPFLSDFGTPLLSVAYNAVNALYRVVISIYLVVKSMYGVVISIYDMVFQYMMK